MRVEPGHIPFHNSYLQNLRTNNMQSLGFVCKRIDDYLHVICMYYCKLISTAVSMLNYGASKEYEETYWVSWLVEDQIPW